MSLRNMRLTTKDYDIYSSNDGCPGFYKRTAVIGAGFLALGIAVKEAYLDDCCLSFLYDAVGLDTAYSIDIKGYLAGFDPIRESAAAAGSCLIDDAREHIYCLVSGAEDWMSRNISDDKRDQIMIAFFGGTFSNFIAHELWGRRKKVKN